MKGSSSKPRQKFSVHNYEQRKPFNKKQPEEKGYGFGVRVHGDDSNKAWRIVKKKILKADILNETIERQHFIKKSEKKRRAKAAGKQRWLRKCRETPGPHNYKKNYRKKAGQ